MTAKKERIYTYPNKHYRGLKKLVSGAAKKAKISESEWMRQALTEKLERERNRA